MTDRSSKPRSVEDVDTLVERMTLEEKVAQLGTVRIGTVLEDGSFSERNARELLPNGIGRITRVGRESHLQPAALAEVVADAQAFLRTETRLGIPAFVREESLCGYAGRGGSVFPQSIGMASTWNPARVRDVAATISEQLSAIGIDVTLSPMADVARDPRWGRTEETYGEDPLLVATMASAYVDGLQCESNGDRVDATLKHFAGHGASAGGRNRASVDISPRAFRETHLFPFEAAIRNADAASVMAAYHDVDGIPCHASRHLLTDLLRDDWGFGGTVVSDGRGIEMLHTAHNVVESRQAAGVAAIKAGIDVELPERCCFGEGLRDAVRNGDLDEETVDRAVRRHLHQKAHLGLFAEDSDRRSVGDAFEATDAASGDCRVRSLAREVACESIVLLQNRNDRLPLSRDVESIAVVGPNADEPRHLLGNYAYGAAELRDSGVRIVTPLEGIRQRASDDVDVTHAKGCGIRGRRAQSTPADEGEIADAVDVTENADVVVACVGGTSGIDVERDSSATSGEGIDRMEVGLPGRQSALLRALHETETPLVVVLINGRPLAVEWIADTVPTVLEAWVPGEEGGTAIADVLFGNWTPGGKLPVTIPRTVGSLPIHAGQKPVTGDHTYAFAESEPLYPFGHGESYTEFAYSALEIEPAVANPCEDVTVCVDVANVGSRRGAEVVQVYATDSVASRVRPASQLVGFARTTIEPRKERTVSVTVPTQQLAFYDRKGEPVLEPGTFEVAVGSSAADIRATGSFEVRGERTTVETRARLGSSEVGEQKPRSG
ncbi:glycoside hydrolase family 3 N-terminal domain-containing protein [Halosolutus halophilus]|uniref:glycoside hydrolase family 3 N-terminal domain-containing protein n=1 Tax=Halosolutus halophilus TaxID=1552990 RepID=UPI00223510AB|nr:glycoside hydrolase family 3 N-terminal domain-containing protein [Halosolutus halophilus]